MQIIQAFTPNKDDRKGQTPQIIVIHIGEGSKEAIISEFKNPKTEKSSHYLICKDGSILQFVDENLRAWGNGIVWQPQSRLVKDAYLKGISINAISISIECEGWSYQDPTEAYYKSVVELVKDIARRFNIPIDQEHIIPHRWIRADKTCPGRISVGKIIAMANAPIAPVAPTIPAVAYTTATFVANPPLVSIPSWLSNFLYRQTQKLGNIIWGDRMFGAARDGSWARESKAYLKIHNVSELSGKKGTFLNPLVIHHVIPVSRDKSKEMDKSNWVVLTTWEHLVFAHLGSWLSYNPTLREDIEIWKKKYNERP